MRLLALLAATLLAGCALPLVEEPTLREVSGPTDGYTPTASFLKVHVEREDGRIALLDFDRREWHAAEIARRIDQREVEFLSAQALPRDILNEYLVDTVAAPGELQGLRFDDMGATPEQRAQADAEYDDLLRRFAATLPDASHAPPALAVPSLP